MHVDSWKETYAGILPQAHLDDLGYRGRENLWKGLDLDRNPTFVAQEGEDGEIVAFASGGAERSNDSRHRGELYSIYVLRAHQGMGLGRALVRLVAQALHERGMDSMLVWVLATNPARDFYRHLGAEPAGAQLATIFELEVEEVAYGWGDTASLRR